MKRLAITLFLSTACSCLGQTQPDRLSFFLPQHAGHLSLNKDQWNITELSAKPNGNEFGIRAENGNLHFLGFLFMWTEKAPLTAESCQNEMLQAEGAAALAAIKEKSSFRSTSGVEIAALLFIPGSGNSSAIRAFVAAGDLCGDLSITLAEPITKQTFPMEKVKGFLETLQFSPNALPTFRDAFAYATVEWDHHQLQGAANAYKAALTLVDKSDDPKKWRRVVVDQLAMAEGMSGDLKGSRATNEEAIARDPEYPLYYYNLACADAEAGDASAARKHLQQAFDRRSNTFPGEAFPDPTKDDSLQKLKSNAAFWLYASELSKQLNR